MLALCRIDERLLHGQIAVNWANACQAKKIICIDDATAASSVLSGLIKSTKVPGCDSIEVISVDEAKELLKTDPYTGDTKILLLAKVPKVYLELIEAGIPITEINVGNMGTARGRKKLLQYVWANDQEIDDFKALLDKGVEMYAQDVPRKPKKNVRDLI